MASSPSRRKIHKEQQRKGYRWIAGGMHPLALFSLSLRSCGILTDHPLQGMRRSTYLWTASDCLHTSAAALADNTQLTTHGMLNPQFIVCSLISHSSVFSVFPIVSFCTLISPPCPFRLPLPFPFLASPLAPSPTPLLSPPEGSHGPFYGMSPLPLVPDLRSPSLPSDSDF